MKSDESGQREIVTTRVIKAPRELVFAAWTEPGHLARWWGPKGFTNTFHEFEAKPGGVWRFDMHAPDGKKYPNKSIFTEIVKPDRIVFEHLEPVHKFLATATFANADGHTRLTFCMRFESTTECERVKGFVSEANEQNFDRLEAELGRMADASC